MNPKPLRIWLRSYGQSCHLLSVNHWYEPSLSRILENKIFWFSSKVDWLQIVVPATTTRFMKPHRLHSAIFYHSEASEPSKDLRMGWLNYTAWLECPALAQRAAFPSVGHGLDVGQNSSSLDTAAYRLQPPKPRGHLSEESTLCVKWLPF